MRPGRPSGAGWRTRTRSPTSRARTSAWTRRNANGSRRSPGAVGAPGPWSIGTVDRPRSSTACVRASCPPSSRSCGQWSISSASCPPRRHLRSASPLEQIERLRLLAHCCYLRRRPWSLERCVARLEALAAAPDPQVTSLARSYGLATLGITRYWQGRCHEAAEALYHGLDLLAL